MPRDPRPEFDADDMRGLYRARDFLPFIEERLVAETASLE
jgi:hypothetical protein